MGDKKQTKKNTVNASTFKHKFVFFFCPRDWRSQSKAKCSCRGRPMTCSLNLLHSPLRQFITHSFLSYLIWTLVWKKKNKKTLRVVLHIAQQTSPTSICLEMKPKKSLTQAVPSKPGSAHLCPSAQCSFPFTTSPGIEMLSLLLYCTGESENSGSGWEQSSGAYVLNWKL